MTVKNYKPPFFEKFDFISNMCGRVRVSDDLREFANVSNLAVNNYNYFSPNSETFINAIIFKTDRFKPFNQNYSIKPHVLNFNKENYAVFFLKNPVRIDKDTEKTKKIEILLKLAFELLFKVYGDGEKPKTYFVMMPNPLKKEVSIILGSQPLFELKEIVDCFYSDNHKKIENVKDKILKTNTKDKKTLFNQLRWWCYETEEKNQNTINTRAAELNAQMSKPLKQDEVARISNSTGKFMREKFKTKEKLTPEQIKQKQKDNAKSTHEKRTENVRKKIIDALISLETENKKITKTLLAKEANVSIKTVAKYWG